MGTNTPVADTPERELHIRLMRSISQDLYDLPMVLKGGTALLLCYGLDRFSEDLDFDSPKKFNIQGRVEKILSAHTKSFSLKTVKDTETVQRIKAHYAGQASDRLLKIETSYRSSPDERLVTSIDGIRTYTIGALIEQKTRALAGRTAARDLYDIAFLTRKYPSEFSEDAIKNLVTAFSDVDAVEQRYKEAFEEDEILDADSLTEILLNITSFLNSHS